MTLALLLLIGLLALLLAPAGRRCGVGVNDLSRWRQYGGTLDRPPPPPAIGIPR